MSRDFHYAWKLELIDPRSLAKLAGFPVLLADWEIESNAATDRARVSKFYTLLSPSASFGSLRNYVVFGDVQNPGWNEGFIAKIYGDDSFVATDNSGTCLAHGSLNQLQAGQNLEAIKARLLTEGFMSSPKEPTTRGLDHYRTRFIELSLDGVRHLRTDAEVVDFGRKHPTKKEEDFRGIFRQEEPFISSILRAGRNYRPTELLGLLARPWRGLAQASGRMSLAQPSCVETISFRSLPFCSQWLEKLYPTVASVFQDGHQARPKPRSRFSAHVPICHGCR